RAAGGAGPHGVRARARNLAARAHVRLDGPDPAGARADLSGPGRGARAGADHRPRGRSGARRALVDARRARGHRGDAGPASSGGVPTRPARGRGASAAGRRRRLAAPAVGDRRAPVAAEGLRCEAYPGWGLAALVLGAVDQRDRPLDHVRVEAVRRELLERAILLDVRLEHAVERVVGRERVLVELALAQLRARGAVNDRLRDQFSSGLLVEVAREPEDVGLEDVLEQREA